MSEKKGLKVIIAGGRDFNDFQLALAEFISFSKQITLETGLVKPFFEVVSGGARGADLVGEQVAKSCHLNIKRFIPNWGVLGKRAGFVRNTEMADYGDALLAFWDGVSRGTKNMIDTATRKGLIVKVVMYERKTE